MQLKSNFYCLNEMRGFPDTLFRTLLSDQTKEKGERLIIFIAVATFTLHLIVIALVNLGVVPLGEDTTFFTNPISAIYTPFSFILLYEVYLLIYYLPKSTTNYIGKQYEVITLIVIRRTFKDLPELQLTLAHLEVDVRFLYDIIATLVLFALLWLFYHLNRIRFKKLNASAEIEPEMRQFINIKKWIALALVPLFFGIAFYSFVEWIYSHVISLNELVYLLKDIDNIFFDEFFTVLILTDVLLLLYSFLHTDDFSQVIRNSGFVISTILIKLSFATDGLINILLILGAVCFGVLILFLYNLHQRERA